MTIQFPVYTFHFLYSSCGCSSKGLPASEELPVSVSTTSKVTLQPTLDHSPPLWSLAMSAFNTLPQIDLLREYFAY